MKILSNIPQHLIALTPERPPGYAQADDARNRAAITEQRPNDHERKALTRLDKVLDAKRPPRQDVPRGFYLDIRV